MAGCVSIPERDTNHLGETLSSFAGTLSDCTPEGLISPSAAPTPALDPARFSVAVWNAHKGSGAAWRQELTGLLQGADILALQEAQLSQELRDLLQADAANWNLSTAFMYQGENVGVLTASRPQALYECSIRMHEPWAQLPKQIMIQRFPLGGTNQSLVVANAHLINFTIGTEAYEVQMQALQETVSLHNGPLILAGDFNTWSDARQNVVNTVASALEMQAVEFIEDNRTRFRDRPVDFIFYRGLELLDAAVSPMSSSDHNPLQATFRYQTAAALPAHGE